MTKAYFRCDPVNLCDGASCCRNVGSIPELSIGCYLTLSEFTGVPVVDIWEEKGGISLTAFPDLPNGVYKVGVGLFRDPCLYLSDDNRCSVYPARPLACAGFPFGLIEDEPDQINAILYQDCRCISGVELSPEQKRLNHELNALMKKESRLDLQHFWTDGPKYYHLGKRSEYNGMAEMAIELQMERDPTMESPKSQSLLRAKDQFDATFREARGRIELSGHLYASFWAPVLSVLFKDAITMQFKSLDESVFEEYRKTRDG